VNQHVNLFALFFLPSRSGEETPYLPLLRRFGDCEWSTISWTNTTNSKKGMDRERYCRK